MTYLNHSPAVVEEPQTPAGEDMGLHHKLEVDLLGAGLGVVHTFDQPSLCIQSQVFSQKQCYNVINWTSLSSLSFVSLYRFLYLST